MFILSKLELNQKFVFSALHLIVRQLEMTGEKKCCAGVYCASVPFYENVYLFILTPWEKITVKGQASFISKNKNIV